MQFSLLNLSFVNYIHLIIWLTPNYFFVFVLFFISSCMKKLISEAIIYIWNYSELLISDRNNFAFQIYIQADNRIIIKMIEKYATLRKQS